MPAVRSSQNRSGCGPTGSSFRSALQAHEGHIRVGGLDKDITCLDADPHINDDIPIDRVNKAFDRVVAKDVCFRFVMDNSTLPKAGA